ncbi:MAG: hypothetical protein C4548_07780 [Desulfobacteraceae bacterium]|nr:MAG: hypothetical protein C4548_07780 [Desulfobacteraceae bacterium]
MFSGEILNNGNLLDNEIILKQFIRMLNKSILLCIICFLEKFVNPESPTSGKGFRPSAQFLQATVVLLKSCVPM